MDSARLIARLEGTPAALVSLLAGIPAEDARWKPSPTDWSILEIVCHLGDEEVEDFRMRLRLTLERPDEAWPPIDPEGAARERRYNEQDFGAALARFGSERAASMQWLRSLGAVDWTAAYQHPKFGPIAAGELLVSWATHDALHLRQIAKRLLQLAERDGAGFKSAYAGNW
ncbi:MAG: DinB family protein [Phycisphaerales bacterium]